MAGQLQCSGPDLRQRVIGRMWGGELPSSWQPGSPGRDGPEQVLIQGPSGCLATWWCGKSLHWRRVRNKLCYLTAVWLGASNFPSLSFSFICKMGTAYCIGL